jgi:thiamine-phosphate pyrophosphorylase
VLPNLALSYYITSRNQLFGQTGQGGSQDALRRDDALKEKVRAAFAAGVGFVQVREKDLGSARLAALVEELVRQPEKQDTQLLVNERLDVAISSGADGVHLPSDCMPASEARRLAGSESWVGVSCHGASDVERAEREAASYVLLSPVFETPSKPGVQALGLELFQAICRSVLIPVLALGGVTASNADACVRAGAAGVAGIRLFQEAADIGGLCRYLHSLGTRDGRFHE